MPRTMWGNKRLSSGHLWIPSFRKHLREPACRPEKHRLKGRMGPWTQEEQHERVQVSLVPSLRMRRSLVDRKSLEARQEMWMVKG